MVLESRLAELLQGQAKKFINGFNAEHLNLGLLSGFLELRNLALNPEPIDELLLGSDLPFVVKAGTLSSAMLQLSLMQGELEIVVDGLTLVMAPACKWLTREEVYQHRTNEMERLEFVHMRSQSQRRSLEREMFRKLFSDYLSRIKITVKNVHVRVEIEGEKCQMRETGHPLSLGLVMNSCDIVPVVETEKGGGGAAGGARESEFLLAETMQLKGLMLYEEGLSKTLVPWSLYQSTRTCELGIFQKMSQDEFVRTMNQTREAHGAVPAGQLLLPPTDVSIKVDLKSQALFTDCHVENCLTLEMVVCLQNPSRLRVTASIVEGMRWLVRRTFDFQMWPFLHALHGKPANGLGRWHVLRSFLALKRRIQSNTYSLPDALRMRIHCKEYIRLYKKKFNGPQSSFHWRRSLPPLTAEDATRLGLIELTYPAEKLVNFRLMAQTEMKTETSINSFAEEGALGDFKRSPRSQVWQVRELTPMEQLHLHGQHGFGTNIFRGLPPPPSNLKVRIDLVAPLGLWWVCKLGAAGDEGSWAVSLDSGRQPVRLLLVDSISDNSVFATCEVPRRAESRPAAVLLARSEAAFQRVLERAPNQLGGGSGASEWSSMLEFHGDLCCWGQVKTLPMAASHSPWDFFGSFSCGQSSSTPNDTSFGRVTPLDELLAKFPRMHGSMLQSASSTAGQQEPFLRMNLPLRLTSGQDGPFLELLRWCLATPEGRGGANSQSMLSGLAMLVRSGYDLAALRLHVSLPKVFLQGVNCHETPLQLPPFDAACHLENGGLVDGFVVGLHNLYNFANLVASMPDVKRPKAANVVPASNARRQMSNVQPVSLHFLEQAPPLLLALGALLAASAVVLAGRPVGFDYDYDYVGDMDGTCFEVRLLGSS
ncbi:Vacuolar protein sorting-associated protein 13a [Durusdinium trenchii]|uniref:Vacuolar protein sorting-associated protein 13a n=1 Tax=Durusdinium trenchii TaxID=1381693 RepID=A0ABP0SNK3_9DINO